MSNYSLGKHSISQILVLYLNQGADTAFLIGPGLPDSLSVLTPSLPWLHVEPLVGDTQKKVNLAFFSTGW